jgi:hypothetical protein
MNHGCHGSTRISSIRAILKSVVEKSSQSAGNLGYCCLWRFANVPELLIRGLESHSASKAADQDCDRHSGAANHWLSMADSRVNSDTLVTFHKLGLPERDMTIPRVRQGKGGRSILNITNDKNPQCE